MIMTPEFRRKVPSLINMDDISVTENRVSRFPTSFAANPSQGNESYFTIPQIMMALYGVRGFRSETFASHTAGYEW